MRGSESDVRLAETNGGARSNHLDAEPDEHLGAHQNHVSGSTQDNETKRQFCS